MMRSTASLFLGCACAVTLPAQSPPSRANPLPTAPSARALFADFERAESNDEQSGAGDEMRRHCLAATGYAQTAPFENCSATLLGNGSVLLVRIVTSCGGDSCGVLGWAYSSRIGDFVALGGDAGGTLEASPQGDFLVQDEQTAVAIPGPEQLEARDHFGGRDEIISVRIDLPALSRRAFAPCFSAVLSPSSRFFVCRDRSANVLKVPLEGGRPELVVPSGVDPSEIRWAPYAYGYPDPVEFIANRRLAFTIERRDGEIERREAAWNE